MSIAANSIPIIQPIYEFGSFQVPGQEELANLRPLFPGKEYIGTDMREGPGVDVVLNLHDIDLPPETAGTIICLDTLEHVEHPYRAMEQMHRVLKPGGVIVISSVMLWPIHDHPYDYWRFTPEAFRSLLKPFTHSFVGFAGEDLFPHTVVGIGFKDTTPQLSEFMRLYTEWQKQNLVDVIGRNWQPRHLAFTNGSSAIVPFETLELQLVQKEQRNQALASLLANKEQELNEIYNSKSWYLIKLLRQARLALAPIGSTRDRIVRQILKVFRSQ